MSRLHHETHRLFAAATPGAARSLVLEIGRPADWARTAALWHGVQADLGWAAPALAVNGADAYQLWFAFAEPLSADSAESMAQALRARYLAELPPHRLRHWPVSGAPLPPPVPAEGPTGRWSAFVAPDLAPLFAETPWLEAPPGDEAQASLLAALGTTRTAEREALLQAPAAAPPPSPPAPRPAQGPTADAHGFLHAVMADAALAPALRVEAAKALLAAPAPAWPTDGAAAPVQRQLDAYNAHDLERFVAEYHDDVQVFRPPAAEPVLVGKAAFAAHYANHRFNLPTLHAALRGRMVAGSIVVDLEHITGLCSTPLVAVAVYAVEDGRIRRVWFH